MKRYYIIWFTDENDEGEYENYEIIMADGLKEANDVAFTNHGDYVISVEPYNP